MNFNGTSTVYIINISRNAMCHYKDCVSHIPPQLHVKNASVMRQMQKKMSHLYSVNAQRMFFKCNGSGPGPAEHWFFQNLVELNCYTALLFENMDQLLVIVNNNSVLDIVAKPPTQAIGVMISEFIRCFSYEQQKTFNWLPHTIVVGEGLVNYEFLFHKTLCSNIL